MCVYVVLLLITHVLTRKDTHVRTTKPKCVMAEIHLFICLVFLHHSVLSMHKYCRGKDCCSDIVWLYFVVVVVVVCKLFVNVCVCVCVCVCVL